MSKHFKKKVDQDTIDKFIQEQFDVIERFLLEEKDPRTLAAERFYDEVPSGIVKVHKTTRAGATVALCSESVRRKELCVMVCRTNRNITKTVKNEVVSVLSRPVKVIHIMRNSFCPRIMDLIAKHPAIELLGIIPLPNCDHCDVAPCPIREAFETTVEDVNVYALTYAKLASLMMSRSKRARELLDKLVRAKNVLFDEVQFLEEGDTVAVNVWEKIGSHEYTLNLDKYNKLAEASPLMQRFLDKAKEVLTSLQPEVEKLKLKAIEDRHLKHLALPIETPAHIRAQQRQREYDEKIQRNREELQRLHPDKSWMEIAMMVGDYRDVIKEIMKKAEALLFSEIVAIQELLIKAITEPRKYGLTEDEIVTLSRLLFIVNADILVISYVRGLEGEQISIQSENSVMYAALRSFLSKLLFSAINERRIIFTTATFGTLKIENLIHLPHVTDYVWGDPMNTSSKFLVVADRFRVSPYNFTKRLESITTLIKAVMERFGPENVQVCTMNRAWSKRIGFESTWYASDLTEGVSSKKRVWVTIGLAEKPVNAKDHLAITQSQYHDNPLNLQGEEFLYYVSQKLRADSVHISSYQAFSRAKDPEGKSRSIVIVIGARKEDVEKCLLWGPTRTLKPVKTEKGGLKFDVKIENPIGKPFITVAPLTTDIEESMHIIDQWMTNGRIEEYRLNWHHIKRIVDQRGYASVKRLVSTYRFPLEETQKLFNELTLPEGYASLRSADGRVKAIVKGGLYEKLTKPSININTRICQDSVQKFEPLISAVTKAKPGEVLTSTYFSKHVSANARRMLNEFFDFLTVNPLLSWLVVTSESGKRQLIFDVHCLNVWASSFPRRFGTPEQKAVNSAVEVLALINKCLREGLSSYISVYDFREGHPSEGGNPVVDRIYIDLDLESPEFKALMLRLEKGEDVLDEVLRLRRTLLAQVIEEAKRLVNILIERGITPRIVLSGFKGVNVFIDFVPVQFSFPGLAKKVLEVFTEKVVKGVKIDMSVVGDLSRICRIPNSLHAKASKVLGRLQFCVPITIDELKSLTVDKYDALCSSQRLMIVKRVESVEVSRELAKIVEELDPDDFLVNVGRHGYVKDPELVAEYERETKREILASEDYEELRLRPCFKRIRRESIQLDGSEGHNMRLAAVCEMIMNEISILSIVNWFDFCADFDPEFTRRKVEEIISYGYGRKEINEFGEVIRKPWRCSTIIKKCPSYCLRENCPTYRRLLRG